MTRRTIGSARCAALTHMGGQCSSMTRDGDLLCAHHLRAEAKLPAAPRCAGGLPDARRCARSAHGRGDLCQAHRLAEERAEPTAGMRVRAGRPISYGTGVIERGEVFELGGLIEDGRLLAAEDVVQFDGAAWPCGICATAFASWSGLVGHVGLAHRGSLALERRAA